MEEFIKLLLLPFQPLLGTSDDHVQQVVLMLRFVPVQGLVM